MGIAAYNRGSRVISQRIDAEMRPVEFEMMERLNALPKYEDAGTPLGPINFIYDPRGFWSAECSVTGFGFWYKTLHEAVRRWNVTITGFDCGIWQAQIN
jgi:hypothetical protein